MLCSGGSKSYGYLSRAGASRAGRSRAGRSSAGRVADMFAVQALPALPIYPLRRGLSARGAGGPRGVLVAAPSPSSAGESRGQWPSPLRCAPIAPCSGSPSPPRPAVIVVVICVDVGKPNLACCAFSKEWSVWLGLEGD